MRGVKCGDVLVTYKMIWWDVRTSVDWLHIQVYMTMYNTIQLSCEIMIASAVKIHQDIILSKLWAVDWTYVHISL